MIESELHLVSAVFIMVAAVIPLYLSIKLRNDELRMLAMMLGAFSVIHSFYHLSGALGLELLADGVLEPLSVIVLISFGVTYLNERRKHGVTA